jgi:plastocyanin
MPVAAIILIVFGILGFALYFREVGAVRPLARQDHWHANYEVFICGQKQPVVPEFEDPEGVHTHADGIVHIHPFIPAGEGAGARLARWFEYGGDALGTGGKLSDDTLHVPGDFDEYKNGDLCEGGELDGEPGIVQVFVNQEPKEGFDRYIPQDGDFIRIVFAPEGKLPPGTVITAAPTPIGEVDRTVAVEASDRGRPEVDSFFDPDSISINADERVRFDVTNTGSVSHNLRIAGLDQEYNTDDDSVSEPVIITPGETGTLVEEIEEAGTYAFRCDIHPQVQFGTLTVDESEGG